MDQTTIIPWKKRSDLVVNLSRERGVSSYVVKDPISLQYFSFSEVEYFILKCLTGKVSLETVRKQVLKKFAEHEFSVEEIKAFLSSLIGSNLLVSTRLGYGRILANKKLRQKNHATRWISRFNILTIRWKGIDPDSILKKLDSYVGWIFSTPALILFCLLVVSALTTFGMKLMGGGLEQLQPQSILTAQNIPLLMLAIVSIKVLHEFGHGLTCVHYGGECHEMGLLFIAFCPLPYCDTTDSWLHESRWNRALVASAGIIVEVFIASICCILWALSVPGILNLMLFNIMLVCSVNTILVNGNPLLRYDGYYVLSDSLNYPNLGPEARQLAVRWFERLVYGVKLNDAVKFRFRRLPVAIYGAASGVYRIFVMVMILWAVHQILKSYGLESLTVLIAFPMIASFVMSLIIGVVRRGKTMAQSTDSTSRKRAFTGMTMFLGIISALLFVPLPYTVDAPFSFEPGTCKPVYVSVPGRLVNSHRSFTKIEEDDIVATLVNPDVQFAVEQTESGLSQRALHLENLQKLRSISTAARSSIPAAEESLKIAQERFEAEKLRASRLNVKSPSTGTLYPARNQPAQNQVGQKIRFWNGSILDEANLSAWVTEQTLLGWVGSEEDFQAVVYVPQEQMAFIQTEAQANLVFMSAANEECVGKIVEIGNETVQEAPRELFYNALLSANSTLGQFHPNDTLYRVRVTINEGQTGPLYSTGIAKIRCRPVSLFHRFWRALSHAFALEF